MSTALDRIIEEVRALPPEEQQQLRERLNAMATASLTEEEREDEFERALAAEGIIDAAKPLQVTDEEIQRYRAYQPITVEGQPLSEMIIEERR